MNFSHLKRERKNKMVGTSGNQSFTLTQKMMSPSEVFPSNVVYVELGRNEGMSFVKASVDVPADSGHDC